jgi:hypothetical protein
MWLVKSIGLGLLTIVAALSILVIALVVSRSPFPVPRL